MAAAANPRRIVFVAFGVLFAFCLLIARMPLMLQRRPPPRGPRGPAGAARPRPGPRAPPATRHAPRAQPRPPRPRVWSERGRRATRRAISIYSVRE